MTTSPRSVKVALAALLNADDDLTTVTFHTATKPGIDLVPDYVVLGDVTGTDSPFSMGGGQLSEYSIECVSRFRAADADAAHDRAWEVKDAIAQVLADGWTVSGNVMDAQIGRWEIPEMIDPDDGRVAGLEFEINVTDRN